MENERNRPGARRIPVGTNEERPGPVAGSKAGDPAPGSQAGPLREDGGGEVASAAIDAGARVEEVEARLREMEDRWRRAAADLDNYRKRFQRELARAIDFQRESMLKPWLEVVDNMERALASEGASSNPWFDGMEAIHQQMLVALRRLGVEPFDALGEIFDPQRHEAVATANLADKPEGIVVEAVQTGYALNGKVLRPARVIPVKHG